MIWINTASKVGEMLNMVFNEPRSCISKEFKHEIVLMLEIAYNDTHDEFIHDLLELARQKLWLDLRKRCESYLAQARSEGLLSDEDNDGEEEFEYDEEELEYDEEEPLDCENQEDPGDFLR